MFSGVGGFEVGIANYEKFVNNDPASVLKLIKSNVQELRDKLDPLFANGQLSLLDLEEKTGKEEVLAVKFECVGVCEIDTPASQVLQYRFPNVKNYHDATKIDTLELPDFDLLVGGFPCFAAGTLITTQRGQIPIEEVVVGDIVLTHRNRWRRVLRTMSELKDNLRNVSVQGSHDVKVTGNHPFYCRKRIAAAPIAEYDSFLWIDVDSLDDNTYVAFGKGSRGNGTILTMKCHSNYYGRFISRENIDGLHLVYNLEVEEDNSYVANNLIVKNCQSFSAAGNRKGMEEARGTLFFEIARVIKDKQPKLCILENVVGLLTHDEGKTFDIVCETLCELGYAIDFDVLNTKYYRLPQNRERVFIVAKRIDLMKEEEII